MERRHRLRTRPQRAGRRNVIVVGLGPIGVELARLLLAHSDVFRVTAVVDRAPHLAGKRLADLLGAAAPKLTVTNTVPPAKGDGDLAFLTTSSSLRSVTASLLALLGHGYHVVSSTEELSYPALREPRLAARVHAAARRAERCVVGTGINPGFAMDVWPLVLASNSQSLEHVSVSRVVDASTRRAPLQRKIGSGMGAAQFETLARQGKIGHVGLVESCAHLGDLLGWSLNDMHETLRPKLATRPLRTAHFAVPKGRVCGIHHRVVGRSDGVERVVLDLQMYLSAPRPRDEVVLQGKPALHCVVQGGFHGDLTTAAQLVSAAARLGSMPPGLHLASELPAPRRPARRVLHVLEQRSR